MSINFRNQRMSSGYRFCYGIRYKYIGLIILTIILLNEIQMYLIMNIPNTVAVQVSAFSPFTRRLFAMNSQSTFTENNQHRFNTINQQQNILFLKSLTETSKMYHSTSNNEDLMTDDQNIEPEANTTSYFYSKQSNRPKLETPRRDAMLKMSTIVSSSSLLSDIITKSVLYPSMSNAVEVDAQLKDNKQEQQDQSILYDTNFQPPFTSVRKYKTITLPNNGLQVLLVSDKRTSNSACAVTIQGAGQFADPDDIPGLAHLMEHIILSTKTTSTTITTDSSTTPVTSKAKSLFANSKRQDNEDDFEEWLEDKCDGTSNGFTAYEYVCFHYMIEAEMERSKRNQINDKDSLLFQESLCRFASLFVSSNVQQTCYDTKVLAREVRRVNTEIFDFENDPNRQQEYLTKAFVNIEHPYSRFSAGNIQSLETIPNSYNINVGQRLYEFYKKLYIPSQVTIVVISSQDLSVLERWVQPFNTAFAIPNPRDTVVGAASTTILKTAPFNPGRFLYGNRYKHMVLLLPDEKPTSSSPSALPISILKNNSPDSGRLTMEWVLNLNYQHMIQAGKEDVTATQVAFVLSQIFTRHGRGSLYSFLNRRGWLYNSPGPNAIIPIISIPVDTSGFQIIKLELKLSVDGIRNRAKVVTAVYDCIDILSSKEKDTKNSITNYIISRPILKQYASVATLFGYLCAPRPPDVIELAVDIQHHTMETVVNNCNGIGPWYRFPSPSDVGSIINLQNVVSSTLRHMSDPDSTVIIAAATSTTLGIEGYDLPDSLTSSIRWLREPITGARFYFDDMVALRAKVEQLILTRVIDREEIVAPTVNPLIPTLLRPPRTVVQTFDSYLTQKDMIVTSPNFKQSSTPTGVADDNIRYVSSWSNGIDDTSKSSSAESNRPIWKVLEPTTQYTTGIIPPRGPPELTCRSIFVFQLLSSRPARANVRQAARGELWKLSFEDDRSIKYSAIGSSTTSGGAYDLAELGAAGGLFYDISYNKYGLRISFMGPSQTLPFYVRWMLRRFFEYPFVLQKESYKQQYLPTTITNRAIATAKQYSRYRGSVIGQGIRNRMIISNLRSSSISDVANEAISFLSTYKGAVAFSQGDLLYSETVSLLNDIQQLYESVLSSKESILQDNTNNNLEEYNGQGSTSQTAIPSISDLTYKPTWKPRFGSPCMIPGVALISDACGRVGR